MNRKTSLEAKRKYSVLTAFPPLPPMAVDVKNVGDMDKQVNVDDVIFEMFKTEDTNQFQVAKLYQALKSVGIRSTDARLKEMTSDLRELIGETGGNSTHGGHAVQPPTGLIDRVEFTHAIRSAVVLVTKAMQRKLVIPEWNTFCANITEFYEECRSNHGGEPSHRIPRLAKVDPDLFAISICTVDGQRKSWGDYKKPFSVQAMIMPFTYALATNDYGPANVHKYVGTEPSGKQSDHLSLDDCRKPHNPFVNTGAILTAALLTEGKPIADRFEYVIGRVRSYCGGEYVDFNNSIFLSERETGFRNHAIAYYLKENNCYPEGVNIANVLDFYFQLSSLELTSDSAVVLGATLANGGICPVTGERVLSNESCRYALSLMYSCGMYEYSGRFAFKVGLPAKSAVSGCHLLVVPNVCAFCIYSPRLDKTGNPLRAIQFCELLEKRYRFHNFDNRNSSHGMISEGIDPTLRSNFVNDRTDGDALVHLLFACKRNDMSAVKSYVLQGIDIDGQDYDGRTALHVAASEGHARIVQFLIKHSQHILTQDRWNKTPLDDAIQFKSPRCQAILEKAVLEANVLR